MDDKAFQVLSLDAFLFETLQMYLTSEVAHANSAARIVLAIVVTVNDIYNFFI